MDHNTNKEIPVTVGSGNVFADIGVPNPDEALLKAQLAYRLNQIIEKRELTQLAAAEILGVDQPKVSALRAGRLRGFSVDRLIRFLNLLGSDVEIVVRPAINVHGETRVSVLA